jgi:hypothetical protein
LVKGDFRLQLIVALVCCKGSSAKLNFIDTCCFLDWTTCNLIPYCRYVARAVE